MSTEGTRLGNRIITDQKTVHYRKITYGWIPLMVHDICPGIMPWKDFPMQSDKVKKETFLKPVNEN